MKGLQEDLYRDLKSLLAGHRSYFHQLREGELKALEQKPKPESWSALECLEHLCRYGDFYLTECQGVINGARPTKASYFKSSWLGEYFAKSMWPAKELKKMNTFKSMNPSYSETRPGVLAEFEQQLEAWDHFLAASRDYSWQQLKTSISISKLIKLRLGDTLRVVLYHQERHLRQALRAANL